MDALHLAAAVEILTGDDSLTAICVWCLDERDPHCRVTGRRAGGDCMFCSYSGPDTVCAMLKPERFALDRTINIDVKSAPALLDGTRYVTMDDDFELTPISWICIDAHGTRHGGGYSTHAGASKQIIEHPGFFADCRVIPAYNVRRGYSGPYDLIPFESDQSLDSTHGVAG
jgi:hypothetical protein